MSAYPTCPHGHSDPNFNCPLCRADAALVEQARELDEVTEKHRALVHGYNSQAKELDRLEKELKSVRICFSEASHNAGPAFVAHEELASLRQRLADAERRAETVLKYLIKQKCGCAYANEAKDIDMCGNCHAIRELEAITESK